MNIKGGKELIYCNAGDCDLSDKMTDKIYNDLPQGENWKNDNDTQCSSEAYIRYNERNNGYKCYTGNLSITKKKGGM